jgi:hypothetical protein
MVMKMPECWLVILPASEKHFTCAARMHQGNQHIEQKRNEIK